MSYDINRKLQLSPENYVLIYNIWIPCLVSCHTQTRGATLAHSAHSGCLGAVTFASNFFNFCYCPVLSEVGGVGFRTPRFDNGPAK